MYAKNGGFMNSPSSSTLDFIVDLKAAVDRIPSGEVARLDISDAPDVMLSEVEALKGIADLGSLAGIGESEALSALVRIGNQVTEILERIAAGKSRSPLHHPSTTHSHAEDIVREDYSRPPIHVAYQGDLGDIEAVFDRWRSKIEEGLQRAKR